MVTKEEQKLIDGCIQGKTESQKQLFLEYGPLVKGICQRYAASPEEGEDMFHDVFVFILTHFKDYNKITSLKGCIYRIAINKAVDHYRKSRAAKFTPIENEEFVVSAPQTPIPEVLTMDQLVAFINELPDRQRTAFNLFAIDGYPQEEVGKMIGETPNNVRTLVFRAKKRLQTRIRNYLNHEEFEL